MPVYLLTKELIFPPPEGASPEGVVAIGGDFSPERLVLAYSQGIFPWPTEGYHLLWFSPDPRCVLPPAEIHLPRSLQKRMRRGDLEVRADTAFVEVVRACAAVPRPGQSGTWIVEPLVEGFTTLHERGLAHSIETWCRGELVGGLYGVSLGGMFFGESMFAKISDASKVAFATLAGNLVEWGFDLIDCQVQTEHLARFGARRWSRRRFLRALQESLARPTRPGPWRLPLSPAQAIMRIQSVRRPP
ncbi:MAG: leucyl/phenylalanyl-tRNA--protein transferase [Sandaracinaceae bacterium]|nr:leucyl/phenylalanyl-tRNA--protein transferase [Sandaracinaceae bacterium]